MDAFAQLRDAIRRVFPASGLQPVAKPELDAIRHRYPNVPAHYLAFLREVGWGSLGPSHFMVYGGLCSADELFDPETAERLEGVLFFGDNFAGWVVGFDTHNDWRIVGVDHAAPEPEVEEAQTIGEFIAERIADWESG